MSTVDTAVDPRAEASRLALQIGTGFILSGALHVAVELRIPDRLAGGPRTAEALAEEAGVLADPLYRVLRALAMVGIFAESAPRTFALTPAADVLRTDVPGSLYGMARWMTQPFLMQAHSQALHSVKTGQPAAEQVAGMPVFEYFAKNPELAARFNDGMTSMSAAVIPAALDAYDFSGIGTLVDVAGGHGEVLTSVLKRYPQMKGVLFDVDHVIAGAKARIDAQGLQARCTTVSGDFFQSVPAGGDAYIMKHIIHDWQDDRAQVILENIRAVLKGRPEGRVLLLESVIRPWNEPDLGKVIDLEMHLTPGGRERTQQE
jgi:hypothetical protein